MLMHGADILVVLGTPSHLEEEVDGLLHRLEVAHVENPQVVNAIFEAQTHLLPKMIGGGDVGPLGITRTAHVIDMVVHTPASLAIHECLFGARGRNVCLRYTTDVAPVIVAKHDEHIIRHVESKVIEMLHFLIECPHLWSLVGLLARHFRDDATLVADDVLKEFLVVFVTILGQMVKAFLAAQSGVAITTHTDGDKVLGSLGALDAFAEELIDNLLVDSIIPTCLSGSLVIVLGTCLPHLGNLVTHPFLVIASHRLMMRSAHNDAHLVGKRAIERVVKIEGIAPHGRPKVVALQAEEQFEDVFVEKVVEATSIGVAPRIDREVLALAIGELLLHPTR